MNKTIVIAAVSLVSGALAGALGGYILAKKKCQTVADEEIQMAQKRMMDILDKYDSEETKPDVDEEQDSDDTVYGEVYKNYSDLYPTEAIKEYEDIVDSYAGPQNDIRIEYTSDDYPRDEMKDHPYLIDNLEFGELDGYSKLSLIYYARQILADESGEIIEDPDHVVGMKNLSQCMLADETYYIRNDQMKCDYEIYVDAREYHEALLEENTPTEEEV